MRAVCLAFALLAPSCVAQAAESTLIDRLAVLGPQDLRISEGLGTPVPDGKARAFVEGGVLVIEIQRDKSQAPRVFRYDGKPFDRNLIWSDPYPHLDFRDLCDGGGTAEVYQIECFSRSDLMSRALRPPHTVWTLRLSSDGLRIVQQGRERLTLTPVNAAWRGDRTLAPGLPATLGDALRQLAAHEKGGLGGGSSGRGDWYASDLWVTQVRGLDFKLARTVWEGRGGRSDQVPASWSFDYQGPDRRNGAELAWHMVRIRKGAREADFWCVGRPVSDAVDVACHSGGRPSDVRGKPEVGFRLEPFPRWRIHVQEGADNPFASVGTSRLETLPYP